MTSRFDINLNVEINVELGFEHGIWVVDTKAPKKHRVIKEGTSESFVCSRTNLCLCFTNTVNSNMRKKERKKEIVNQDASQIIVKKIHLH